MDAPQPSSPVELPRPAPPRDPLRHLTERVRWFGLGRLLVAAVSVVLVAGGAWWLLAAPAPAAETALPVASAGPSPASTLAPPPTATASPAPSAPASTGPSVIVVHVAGAVVAPGVHTVAAGARVADAVAAAGGVAAGADPDGVNLAAPVVDGQRVYVPLVGEVDPASVPSAAAAGATGTAPPSGPVDLNSATAADLEELPGVGPATAAAIVDDRARNGPFASVDDLDRVSGIGPAKLDALRDLVTV